MKKSFLALAVLGAFSSLAFAESQVAISGIVEAGVLVSKAKGYAANVSMSPNFNRPSRWRITGVEDLGGANKVGFILEQGFSLDTGNVSYTGHANSSGFSREAWMYVTGDWGELGAGRTGSLSLGTQSQDLYTGWAFTTAWGMAAWTTIGSFGRVSNAVGYKTPKWGGLYFGLLYGNSLNDDDNLYEWSRNTHYYGIGAKYQSGDIRSSLIYECFDGRADRATRGSSASQQAINFGFEYNLGSVTPMFAYQWANNTTGRNTNMFGLSALAPVGGGDLRAGVRYVFGEDNTSTLTASDNKVRMWNINVAYTYPLSKRTHIKGFAGYAGGSKAWKDPYKSYSGSLDAATAANFNGYQIYVGMDHDF